jgi:peptidoglycan/xylan/chitin deacetylase (PgdA/CDA1 family)
MREGADPRGGVPRRIVLYTSSQPTAAAVELFEALARTFEDWSFLLVAGDLKRTRARWVQSKLRRLRREPLSYPLSLAWNACQRLRSKPRAATGRVGLPRLEAGDLGNVVFRRFTWIHGEDCLAAVRSFEPWLGIAIGAPVLNRRLFEIPERGSINVHKSLLPDYRGLPPGFWEIHDGEQRSGVSVHWIDSTLDTGAIVRQREVAIPEFATVRGLQAELDHAAIPVLLDAVRDIDRGVERAQPQAEPGTATHTQPDFLLARRVHRRTLRRRKRVDSWPRNWAKAVVLSAYVHVWAALRNRLRARRGRCHVACILYHRVSDHFLDTVTVGVEQFERHLSLLRRHYDVLDMDDFLRSRGAPRRRPAVVVTFDDGYRDNHMAARLLRREGLPCTFFLCTRIVGTERRFPHDVEAGVTSAPALSWEEVREMRDWGFGFGNHTDLHRNVARIPLEEALEAIRDARADLLERLPGSGSEQLFAYPYGRAADISEEVRAQLPGEQIAYCFGAYGGVNDPEFDLLNIQRQGVSHNVSEIGLRAIVEGWNV